MVRIFVEKFKELADSIRTVVSYFEGREGVDGEEDQEVLQKEGVRGARVAVDRKVIGTVVIKEELLRRIYIHY